ncbi:hypothetical protein DCAR_0310323 [Daucus carota subsp. sativus]|uniref:Uncharacterized protein n=1 Tax=Daucus carota subsp. sativus TaxID=79200 RepID=A0A165ZSL1_DAUCS|nr:hypothetical protein DCAR_0310323 [Daucus carota subsp. sativus]
MAEKNLDENTVRLLFRAKPMFLKRVVDNLSDVQRQWVVETGFEKVLIFNINEYPQPLSFLIAQSYKSIDSSISTGENIVNFSENDVHNILGLPKGGLMFEDSYNSEYTDVWRSQFKEYKEPHRISAKNLCDVMESSKLVDLRYKLNFLIVLTNVLIQGSRTPYVFENSVVFREFGSVL